MRSPWGGLRVTQLVHDRIGVESGDIFAVEKVDQGVSDHVHALGEDAGSTHCVQPFFDPQCTAAAEDLSVRVKQRRQGLDIPMICGPGISLE